MKYTTEENGEVFEVESQSKDFNTLIDAETFFNSLRDKIDSGIIKRAGILTKDCSFPHEDGKPKFIVLWIERIQTIQ